MLEQLMLLLLWQANADNIIKHGIFMGKINYCIGKFIFALANLFLHWQIYVCMGNFIIAWENLLLHWQICLHGQFYYCMGKSILYGHNYFAWAVFTEIIVYATKDSFQNLERNLLFSCV